MTQIAADTFRTLGPGDEIPNDFVVPYYLDDRKLRVSVARVDDCLYAFDDLCTCADASCPLSGGLTAEPPLPAAGGSLDPRADDRVSRRRPWLQCVHRFRRNDLRRYRRSRALHLRICLVTRLFQVLLGPPALFVALADEYQTAGV